MKLLESYVELMDSDREFEAMPAVPSLRQAVGELAEAAERGQLTTSGAWRISREAAKRMEHQTGYRPPGGWRRLAALTAGAPVLNAKRDEFAPDEAKRWCDWDESQTRAELIEAFAEGLVPPTTAAGLFIMLGIHPAWGVHLAHESRSPEGSDLEGSEMFPQTTLEIVRETVFGTISCIVATFRNLEPGREYPVALLADVIADICRAERNRVSHDPEEESGLAPFVETSSDGPGTSSWRVTDFTTGDLLDAWLVPAGAVARHDDGTFSVFPEAFSGVTVGGRGPTDQQVRLSERIGRDGSRVA